MLWPSMGPDVIESQLLEEHPRREEPFGVFLHLPGQACHRSAAGHGAQDVLYVLAELRIEIAAEHRER